MATPERVNALLQAHAVPVRDAVMSPGDELRVPTGMWQPKEVPLGCQGEVGWLALQQTSEQCSLWGCSHVCPPRSAEPSGAGAEGAGPQHTPRRSRDVSPVTRQVQRQARSVLESFSVPNIKVVLKEHRLRAGYSKAPLSASVNEVYPPCNAFQERLWCSFVCYDHGIYAREPSSQQRHSYHRVPGEDLAFLRCTKRLHKGQFAAKQLCRCWLNFSLVSSAFYQPGGEKEKEQNSPRNIRVAQTFPDGKVKAVASLAGWIL